MSLLGKGLKVLGLLAVGAVAAIVADETKKQIQTNNAVKANSLGLNTNGRTSISTHDLRQLMDNELEESIDSYNDEYSRLLKNGDTTNNHRLHSIELIDEARDIINSIASHPKEFDVSFEKINAVCDDFENVQDYAKRQFENAKKSAITAGVGVATGIGIAALAPSAAMWLATTFGIASTGVAINALSGAAATKAALAWLGGGTLAMGGAGIAGGKTLLAMCGPIGWGIAGSAIITASFLYNRRNKQIYEEKSKEILDIKRNINNLKMAYEEILSIKKKTININATLKQLINACDYLRDMNYSDLAESNKMLLGELVNICLSASKLLKMRVKNE